MAYISQYSGEVIDASIKNIVDDIYVNESGDTINGTLTTKELTIQSTGQPSINFRDENGNLKIGINTNETYNRFNFIQYGPDQSGYYEYYSFPNGTNGLIDNKQYIILTEKNYLDMIYPIGSCYTTSTNTNPSSTLGGTWELIDKQFMGTTITSSGFTINTTNVTSLNHCYIARYSHTIEFSISLKLKVALADTSLELGTLNFSTIGISRFFASPYIVGNCDGGNGFSNAYITNTTGVLTHLDCVTKAANGSLAAENNLMYHFCVNIPDSYMLDSACDQFIWKRTT